MANERLSQFGKRLQRVGKHIVGIPCEGDKVDLKWNLGFVPPNITVSTEGNQADVNLLDSSMTDLTVGKEIKKGHFRLTCTTEDGVLETSAVHQRHLKLKNPLGSVLDDLRDNKKP